MPYNALADLVVLFHLGFIAFVVTGGLFAWRWPRLAWVHLPAAAWGALIELGGWICPLTPLENRLRQAGGATAYEGGFIDHYIVPLIYPPGLTRGHQIVLGLLVLGLNAGLYFLLWRRHVRSADQAPNGVGSPAEKP